MKKIAFLVLVTFALGGCAAEASSPDPNDQEETTAGEQQAPKKAEATAQSPTVPVVVTTGTTPLLKTRH